MRVGESANNSTVELAVGETLEICLPETPSTGYRWQVTADGSPACAIAGDGFAVPSTAPGRVGEHRWTVTAVHPDNCDIELQHRRPWEGAAAPGRIFKLHVRVRS